MKKMICVLMAVVMMFVVCGCSDAEPQWEIDLDFMTAQYSHVYEYVSSDGVHYWATSNGGLAPRYDKDGNLVIDR